MILDSFLEKSLGAPFTGACLAAYSVPRWGTADQYLRRPIPHIWRILQEHQTDRKETVLAA